MNGEEERIASIIMEITDNYLDRVSEYADSVQVCISFQHGDSTLALNRGSGNWYSRVGTVREWLEADRARTDYHAIEEEKEDDSEED